jgi:c-di-AMP phosphodiesterase-like protein
MHILPTRYPMIVIIVVAVILCLVWFIDGQRLFVNVSFVCYGFIIGYLAALIHSRIREKEKKSNPR